MFTTEEIASRAHRLVCLTGMTKRAYRASYATPPPYMANPYATYTPSLPKPIYHGHGAGGLFSGNPRAFNQAWDLYQPPARTWMQPHPMTFGDSLGIAGRGVARQLGDYGQMIFGGHKGGPSVMGNLAADTASLVSSPFTGQRPSWKDWKNDITGPFRRALPSLRSDWAMTGTPGEWGAANLTPTYQTLKNFFRPSAIR